MLTPYGRTHGRIFDRGFTGHLGRDDLTVGLNKNRYTNSENVTQRITKVSLNENTDRVVEISPIFVPQ